MKDIPLLKEYLQITKLSQQRYAEIRYKEPKPYATTGPHLTIETLAINIW